mgnify:CR=1 FL=1
MMKINLEVCGSITFDGPPPMVLTHFQIDPENPNRYVPKYTCGHREGRCKMSACGRRPIFRWYCAFYQKKVSLIDCESCNARQ